jgi:hypothetical protein
MSRMIGCVVVALVAILTPCLQGAGLFVVNIEYTEGSGPEGTFLLVQGNEGLVSLDPISNFKKPLAVKVEQIVPVLEEANPVLAGKIKVTEVKADAGKLAEAGMVHVMGQVDNVGDHPAGLLSTCIASAKPTAFSAVTRIQVIRKEKRYIYDLKKKEHSEIKLEPGDVVLVPMKKVIGL